MLLFECGASEYHSFPTNLEIGQERKKNQSWKPCVQETKKKKRDKPRRGNLLPMSLQSDGREQRVTCVCITNKMENGCGLVRELDISFFIFFLCLVLQGRRVLSGGKGEVSVIEEKEIWDRAGMR